MFLLALKSSLILLWQNRVCCTLQAHAPPPGYFVRLENKSPEYDLYLSKKVKMRRWLCCTCQAEESYTSHENERAKSPKNYPDGVFSYS